LSPAYVAVNWHLTCIDVHFGTPGIRIGERFARNARDDRRSALPYDLDRTRPERVRAHRLGEHKAISAAGRAAQEAIK